MKKLLIILSVIILPLFLTSSGKIEGCTYILNYNNNYYKEKTITLRAKVKVVPSGATLKVKVTDGYANLKVKVVDRTPSSCGEWQFVDAFEDFTIQFVNYGEDITIRFVESNPGH